MPTRKLIALGFLAVLTLPACDGGTTPTAVNPTPAPTPTPTPAAVESTIAVPSADVPKEVANNSTTTSVTNVTVDGTVLDLTVPVSISHTWRGDLDVKLRHPDGTTVNLFIGDPRDARDDVIETFTVGNAPDLQRLLGKRSGGVWTLMAIDTQFQDKGTLLSWSLNLRIRQ